MHMFYLPMRSSNILLNVNAGADECSEGTYATSVPLIHVMDVTNDVILSFGQNRRVLHPDHGYVLTFDSEPLLLTD